MVRKITDYFQSKPFDESKKRPAPAEIMDIYPVRNENVCVVEDPFPVKDPFPIDIVSIANLNNQGNVGSTSSTGSAKRFKSPIYPHNHHHHANSIAFPTIVQLTPPLWPDIKSSPLSSQFVVRMPLEIKPDPFNSSECFLLRPSSTNSLSSKLTLSECSLSKPFGTATLEGTNIANCPIINQKFIDRFDERHFSKTLQQIIQWVTLCNIEKKDDDDDDDDNDNDDNDDNDDYKVYQIPSRVSHHKISRKPITKVRNKVWLYGPSGVGKSRMAEALASHFQVPWVEIGSATLNTSTGSRDGRPFEDILTSAQHGQWSRLRKDFFPTLTAPKPDSKLASTGEKSIRQVVLIDEIDLVFPMDYKFYPALNSFLRDVPSFILCILTSNILPVYFQNHLDTNSEMLQIDMTLYHHHHHHHHPKDDQIIIPTDKSFETVEMIKELVQLVQYCPNQVPLLCTTFDTANRFEDFALDLSNLNLMNSPTYSPFDPSPRPPPPHHLLLVELQRRKFFNNITRGAVWRDYLPVWKALELQTRQLNERRMRRTRRAIPERSYLEGIPLELINKLINNKVDTIM